MMLVSFGALAALSTPAEAKALPPGWAPNGCTLSPDFGFVPTYYWFKGACNRHDYCYDELWYGGGESGRKACDDNFLREMNGWCNAQYPSLWQTFMRNQCKGVALVYYAAVRNLGQPYFDNPYKN